MKLHHEQFGGQSIYYSFHSDGRIPPQVTKLCRLVNSISKSEQGYIFLFLPFTANYQLTTLVWVQKDQGLNHHFNESQSKICNSSEQMKKTHRGF